MRYQGMRRVEAIELKWSDVDWTGNRLRFTSRKTGYRECPIFPQTLPYLQEALAVNGDQARVVRWHSDEHSVTPLLRKHATTIVGKAWPKICTNLRSTRRTKLDQFPAHVVSARLGHSEKVALDHYKQVTDDHWDRAATQVSAQVSIFGGQGGIRGAQTDTKTSAKHKKPKENARFAAVAETDEHPREDSKKPTIPEGKASVGVLGGNAGGNIPSDLAELIQLWPTLPFEARQACLQVARTSKAKASPI